MAKVKANTNSNEIYNNVNDQAMINDNVQEKALKTEKQNLKANNNYRNPNNRKIQLYTVLAVFNRLAKDCLARGKMSPRKRVAEIVIKKCASELGEVLKYSLYANTDQLKRSGYGRVSDTNRISKLKDKRVARSLDYSGSEYDMFWNVVIRLAAKYNMTLGCFVSTCVEEYYTINKVNTSAKAKGTNNSLGSCLFDSAVLENICGVPAKFDVKDTPKFRKTMPTSAELRNRKALIKQIKKTNKNCLNIKKTK